MRRRARHRLIGAAVLVLAGVVGFPLLFDSQPRPVPVNVAIDIPDRNKVAPLVLPQDGQPHAGAAAGLAPGEELLAAPERSSQPAAPTPATPAIPAIPVPPPAAMAPVPPLPPPPAPKTEPRPEPKPVAKPEPVPAPRPEPKPAPRPEPAPAPAPKPAPRPEPAPAPAPAPRPVNSDEASRARALLEGRSPPAAAPARSEVAQASRFVVQVGAFADADKAREVQGKLERSGLRAHTQTVQTRDGSRTRVRLGPYSSRAEADRAAERARAIGLAGSVLPQ
ncbi:hypothetical protein GCM10027019_00610 [Melaminivora jejuensis]